MTQGELEKLAIPMGRIFSDLEQQIMSDIVRRIKINGFSTATADWEMTRLQQLGASEKEIRKWVQTALQASEEELGRIYSDEVYRQYTGFQRAYRVKGFEQIPFEDNIPLQQLIEAVKKQVSGEYRSMTGSMGFAIRGLDGKIMQTPLMDFYRETLDDSVAGIHSGVFSYQAVLEKAVNQMTASGVRWIDYSSGVHNRVDVAARRAVLTGFRQIQGQINQRVASDLGTDFYEVSYHVGARPTHQPWQGRVWSMAELQSVCGLGSVTGLCGANCYHDYSAFIPGVSVRAYTDEQLAAMIAEENTPREYLGKEYTTYEALQHQRHLETVMRKYRQDIKLLQQGGAPERAIILKKARYQGKLQEYEAFSNKMKLPMQKKRIFQDGLKGRFTLTGAEKEKVNQIANEKQIAKARQARSSKFSERFVEFNNGQKDIITTRKLLNNLNKSNVGRETVKYIVEHPELNVNMCYKVETPENIFGWQDKDDIYIYATKTATVQKTAEILIHEITHHRYDIGGNQWSECVCRAQELKHRKGIDKLTGEELRDIIKSVKRDYPEYKWR